MRPRGLITLTAGSAVAVLFLAVLQNQTPPATAANQTDAVTQSAPTVALGDPSGPQRQPSRTKAGSTQTKKTVKSGYTMAQVAQHGSASSCWTAINGNVYNLTAWINRHPGGPGPILSLCGTDGSAAFNAQHGGQGRPEAELANFYLGPLTS